MRDALRKSSISIHFFCKNDKVCTRALYMDACWYAGKSVRVVDPEWKRQIVIEKAGFSDVVVWNPWDAKAKAFSDFGDEEYRVMVCIEPANAGVYLAGSSVEVQPGETWTASQSVHAEALVDST
jgi:D-hexose-6-phosphate mutarotase